MSAGAGVSSVASPGRSHGEEPLEHRPTLLLADDHPVTLEGLRRLLETDFEVVGTAADGRTLLEAAQEQRPDLILTDVSMPGIEGVEATRRLRATLPASRVLIFSFHTEPSWVRAAFEAGACGYLTKCSEPNEIGRAVREVLQGRYYVSPVVARAIVVPVQEAASECASGARSTAAGELTARESEVARLVGEGIGNQGIARRLGISVSTVRTHLRKIYDKLGLATRVELALHASRIGRPA